MKNTEKEKQVDLFNRISVDAEQRILFARDLVEKLGILLMMPVAQLEQLIVAGKDDIRILESVPLNSSLKFLQPLTKVATKMAKKQLTMLEGFIVARPYIIDFMESHGIDTKDLQN